MQRLLGNKNGKVILPDRKKQQAKENGTAEAQPVPSATKAVNNKEPEVATLVREVIRPENQLKLSEKDLAEEIPKVLTANNPLAPKNVAKYSYKDRAYKLEPVVDHVLLHFSVGGWLVHRSSEEAQLQLARESQQTRQTVDGNTGEGVGDAQDKDGQTQTHESSGQHEAKHLKNQFNFAERAVQTQTYPPRDRGTMTEPPPTASISGSCSQYEIYIAYVEDQQRQRAQEDYNKAKSVAKRNAAANNQLEDHSKSVSQKKQESGINSAASVPLVQVTERLVQQNNLHDVIMDFKYWEDPSDVYRPGKGSLLPLWSFASNNNAGKKQVTSLSWNSQYTDLFAVGYGSFEFTKQGSGMICCFSLKNPTCPEWTATTESGVMCVAFHPQYPNLLAVGCYDGTVMVHDTNVQGEPLYKSSVKTNKHSDPVWEIHWQEGDGHALLQFASVSSDGRVVMWSMNKSDITHQDMMHLRIAIPIKGADVDPDDEPGFGNLAAGCCFDVNKVHDHLYIVGTMEGFLHKCSTAYDSAYLETYERHEMPVYTVRWNPFHPRVFLSASADWSVRLWDDSQKKTMMTFDLKTSVADVSWAPYSCTVFAAATDDGKVHVFDLSEDKTGAMCEQKVVKKSKLTKLAFNPRHPVIIVGDDRGIVTCLKLSPNLRKSARNDKGEVDKPAELAKLDKVLEIAAKNVMFDEFASDSEAEDI